MTRGGATARFRQRKLSTKQCLQVVREDQIERIDDDQPRNIPQVDTGVEKAEEIEHHLQAAISASHAAAVGGKVAQIHIPTPEAVASKIDYDRFYTRRFTLPETLIRFSSTVEDCIGALYCATAEDEAFIRSLNEKKPDAGKCNVDEFEEIIDFFEQTSKTRQPYAALDNAPVLSLDEMARIPEFYEMLSEHARGLAEEVYAYWKARRLRRGNRPLMPALKAETGQETDDTDPYVCFRRREVRQARKTRGRDAQGVEKLKRLRRELGEARNLLALVQKREVEKKSLLAKEKAIFEQRLQVKDTKRKLGVRSDDDDLLNERPPKKKQAVQPQPAHRPADPQLRITMRQPQQGEPELTSLAEYKEQKQRNLDKDIAERAAAHRQWQDECPDMTAEPIIRTLAEGLPGFRRVAVEVLPTPPATASSESDQGQTPHNKLTSESQAEGAVAVRYRQPSYAPSQQGFPAYRRRIGRGGRLWIGRRNMDVVAVENMDSRIMERLRYDLDDDDDYPMPFQVVVDPYDLRSLQYRATKFANYDQAAQRLAQVSS